MSIIANNLVKQYGKRIVVSGVSVRVDPGEVVGLLGPNGAGKTTTFSMIVGLEKANKGSILLNGSEITNIPMYQRGRLGIAYLPQEASIFRRLTVEENIQAIVELQRLSRIDQQERLELLLQEFHLEQVRRQKGYALSGGERRRTEIARSLATSPGFVLLDEPFAGVDPIAVAEIQEIIALLRKKNLGILVTDHNVRETLRITDRAYIMREGEVLVAGTAMEISENEQARKHYLGANFVL